MSRSAASRIAVGQVPNSAVARSPLRRMFFSSFSSPGSSRSAGRSAAWAQSLRRPKRSAQSPPLKYQFTLPLSTVKPSSTVVSSTRSVAAAMAPTV